MPALKPIAWFFFKVCALYVLFVAIHGEGIYAAAFRVCGNGVYATMGNGGRVRLVKAPPEMSKYDTQARFSIAKMGGRGGEMEFTTREAGYLPTAFTIALILATPIPMKRRALALVAAVALISCFVVFQYYLRFVDVLSQPNPMNVYHLAPFTKGTVRILIKILSLTPVTGYMAPVFIWSIVIFRRGQLSMLASLARGESATGFSTSSPRT